MTDKLGLEIGCGHFVTGPEWLRMDADPAVPNLDYCGSAVGPLPWDDNTFDRIRAVDVLEHIGYRHTLTALREWNRILKPGGEIYIQAPDTEMAVRQYLARGKKLAVPPDVEAINPTTIAGLAWRLMGGQDDGGEYTRGESDWRWNAHYTLFDEESLRWHLGHSGFKVTKLTINPHPNLCCWAVKHG